MKVALCCAGLGRIDRGHEVFARGLFDLLRDDIDITLFKGGGDATPRETVVESLSRNAASLARVHVAVSPKWAGAAQEEERCRIEAVTFAYAALGRLIEGGFEIVHCLEREVAEIVHAERHLFARTPKIVFSNGGAIPARDLPACDFVQEHTERNLRFSARHKAFLIPHGVDVERFRPGIPSDFRQTHGLPADALVVISVGALSASHKRMDHVIREVAGVPHAHLVLVGQEHPETPALRALAHDLMPGRIVITRMSNDALPNAYAAADVFVLGSLFETFGIVYLEAMAMGLPVICTQHPNQREIVREGIFIDMAAPGALSGVLAGFDRHRFAEIGRRGRAIAEQRYDLRLLKHSYLERYAAMRAAPSSLPEYSLKTQLKANLNNLVRFSATLIHGRAE